MLNKRNRISGERLIIKLSRQGEAYKTKFFVFKYLPSHFPESKFALSISKKIAPKAVKRNRLRRQISDALRLYINQIQKPIVCLVIQKKGTPEIIQFETIKNQVEQFINHLNQHV